MRNIKLILEYDGANYHGWQSQAGSGNRTLQQTLEEVLVAVAKEPIRTISSGRTDAGVHALGHVVNFSTNAGLPPAVWALALNRLLPQDIRVLSSEEVPPDFHARFSATGKTYVYRILNRKPASALDRGRVWHVERKLNLSAMRRAAAVLLGRHDFSSFRGSGCGAKTAIRNLRNITIKKTGDRITISLEADAFLMHMARNLVGMLVEAGVGRFSPSEVKSILRARDRTKAGKTAPACGLYLQEVYYEVRRPSSAVKLK